jgi:predicted phosphoribosyltransferase
MMFASRQDAGRRLGRHLLNQKIPADLVLGLPRGGVVVAAEVARWLRLPLGTLVVRKIGHPWYREFAVGALAEHGVVVLDESLLHKNPFIRSNLQEIVQEEQARLQAYRARFHANNCPSLEGRLVILVDDGLATGATTEAAVLSARKQGALAVTVAAPVASTNAVERLQGLADQVIALYVDPAFDAVGRYYDSFSQTTDEEVLELLKAA